MMARPSGNPLEWLLMNDSKALCVRGNGVWCVNLEFVFAALAYDTFSRSCELLSFDTLP